MGRFEDLVSKLASSSEAVGLMMSDKKNYSPEFGTLKETMDDVEDTKAALIRYIFGEGNPKQELFDKMQQEYDRYLTPLYPRVLVEVLGKETQVGHIVMPEIGAGNFNQSKPVYEGIVLDVYPPFTRMMKLGGDSYINPSGETRVLGEGQWYEVKLEARVKIGDHVMFPHWVGANQIVQLNQNWRFVDENEIHAVLDYERKPGVPARALTTSGGKRD